MVFQLLGIVLTATKDCSCREKHLYFSIKRVVILAWPHCYIYGICAVENVRCAEFNKANGRLGRSVELSFRADS